jgi:hypothetical protein
MILAAKLDRPNPTKERAALKEQCHCDKCLPRPKSQPTHYSSKLVADFVCVEISAAARCHCGQPIKPHDFRLLEDTIEALCSSCHRMFLSITLGQNDDEEGDQ